MQRQNSAISTVLESGDFRTAMPLLESMTDDQLSHLVLPLHYACRHGGIAVAESLIDSCKCNIEGKDTDGRTPLHIAAQYGQAEMLKVLLHRLFSHDVSYLRVKVTSGGKLAHALIEMFQLKLLERHQDNDGNSPLHIACINGQLNIARFFIHTIGCDPYHTNTNDMSCLHFAAQHGHLSLVTYLVEKAAASPHLEDKLGMSPLYLAAGGGHLDILRYLIEVQHTDPQFRVSKMDNTKSTTAGRSLLHNACHGGHLPVVQYLVEQCKCDASSKDNEGYTSLHLACQESHQDIVTYLITEGHCDPSAESNNGTTCLALAVLRQCSTSMSNITAKLRAIVIETHHCILLWTVVNCTSPGT